MFGYILAALVLIYFFGFWMHIDGLPPRSARIKRQRLAGKYGLHNKPSIGKLLFTDADKAELVSMVTFVDQSTFSKICASKYFYLVEERNSILSLYCTSEKASDNVTFEQLQNKPFMKIPIEERLLVRFLSEREPIRLVK